MASRRGTMITSGLFHGDQLTQDFEPFTRVLMGWLLTHSDAEGIFEYMPRVLRVLLEHDRHMLAVLETLPEDALGDVATRAWLDAHWSTVRSQFEQSGVAHLYSSTGGQDPTHGWFPQFTKHNVLGSSQTRLPLPPLLDGEFLVSGLVGAVARRDQRRCRMCQGQVKLQPGKITLVSALPHHPPFLRERWDSMHPERPRKLHVAHLTCADRNTKLDFDGECKKNDRSGFDPANDHYAAIPPSFEGEWRTLPGALVAVAS